MEEMEMEEDLIFSLQNGRQPKFFLLNGKQPDFVEMDDNLKP